MPGATYTEASAINNARQIVGSYTDAGGVIQLAGTYLGLTEAQIAAKIADIQTTTSQVLKSSESMSSTHAAAVELANERIAAGPVATQEQVHAR